MLDSILTLRRQKHVPTEMRVRGGLTDVSELHLEECGVLTDNVVHRYHPIAHARPLISNVGKSSENGPPHSYCQVYTRCYTIKYADKPTPAYGDRQNNAAGIN